MIITFSKDGSIPLETFNIFLDISKVKYYTFTEVENVLVLQFYDGKKKLIKLKESQNGKKVTKGKKVKASKKGRSKV